MSSVGTSSGSDKVEETKETKETSVVVDEEEETEEQKEEGEDEYVQECVEQVMQQLLPIRKGLFKFFPGAMLVFTNEQESGSEPVAIERDAKAEIKFKEAQTKVRKMVAEQVIKQVDGKPFRGVEEAEDAMNNIDTYTRFILAIDKILGNKKISAGIIIDPSRTDFIRKRFMILYDYIEDYDYAKVKFGYASEEEIGRASYITACDGITFIRQLKKKATARLEACCH